MKDYFEMLKNFAPTHQSDHITLELPILIFDNTIKLSIYPLEDQYMIIDEGDVFYGYNSEASYYYNKFIEECFPYGIKERKSHFYGLWEEDYNIHFALSEFIKFYVDLERFIYDNNLT